METITFQTNVKAIGFSYYRGNIEKI